MTEQELITTLIEMVKSDDSKKDKDQLLEALMYTEIQLERTTQYSSKLNHCWEDIIVLTSPSFFKIIEENKEYIISVINKIYPDCDSYPYELLNVKFRPSLLSGSINNGEQDVIFDAIKQYLVNEIRAAKYLIWVAMAWFTDKEIYNELLIKKEQGLNIQIILDKNDTNETTEFDLETHFDVYRMEVRSKYKNIMHLKFCIIDLKKVLHGTYNWTRAASYNKEGLDHSSYPTIVDKYADEFMSLKKECLEQQNSL